MRCLRRRWTLSKGDPYERVLPGKRGIVKRYASAMLGTGKLPDPWPSEMIKHYAKRGVTNAIYHLMGKGIPALPVHDSLIIPVSHVTKATRLLTGNCERTIGVRPLIKTKRLSVDAFTGHPNAGQFLRTDLRN